MDKKAFLLRLDPAVWAAIERLAQAELRSVNAEIDYLLRQALAKRPQKLRADAVVAVRPARARRTR